jgi:hypothetical protein
MRRFRRSGSSSPAGRSSIDAAAAGRRIDISTPFVDATMPDGSRLHIVIPDITRRHMAVNIRTFVLQAHSLHELLAPRHDPLPGRALPAGGGRLRSERAGVRRHPGRQDQASEVLVVAEFVALAVTAGGFGRGDRRGHPGCPVASWRGISGPNWAGPAPGCRSPRPCNSWPTARRLSRLRGSSTACSWPSSAAHRWPRCCRAGPERPRGRRAQAARGRRPQGNPDDGA